MYTTEQLNIALDGRYAIERRIGEGGMAIVYLARDLKHDRRVALKVLRPDLGAIVGVERFLAEIRVTANLQHPNLLPLFDSGAADDVLFYVMPFVEGETLRARLDREKQLPVDEAVRMTVAIAGALEHAHAQGIIHRDLKPENILLQAGQPVIADFGIALAISNAGGSRVTQTGLSLGTPMYMSPEQATGDRSIDGRTDLYSLAAMTYEMLTGEAPHTGTSSQAIIAKLMTESPRPLTTLRRSVPPHVNAAVLRALEKVPADRFATPREFASALTTPGSLTSAAAAAETSDLAPRRRTRWLTLAGGVALGVGLGGAGAAAWVASAREAPPLSRVHLAFPDSARPSERSRYAISADGSTFAYRADDSTGNPAQLWIKTRDASLPRLLLQKNLSSFALSRDGDWLAYVEGGRMFKLSTAGGGASVTLADSAVAVLGWTESGDVIYGARVRIANRDGAVAMRVPGEGGPAAAFLPLPDSLRPASSSLLPGLKGMLIGHCEAVELCATQGQLYAVDAGTGRVQLVMPGAVAGWYVEPGHVVALRRDGVLVTMPFDLATLSPKGRPVPLADSIGIFVGGAGLPVPQIAISSEGSLIATAGAISTQEVSSGTYRFVWVNRLGQATPMDSSWVVRLNANSDNYGWAISPDGRRLAIAINRQGLDNIWVKELRPNGNEIRLTTDTAPEYRPRWSRDGREITYHRSTGLQMVARRSADGTGIETVVLPLRQLGSAEHAYSPDGKWIVYRRGGTTGAVGGRDIWIKGTGADSSRRPLIADPKFDEAAFSISPDGRWIAFESNETGVREVYLRPFPNTEAGKWKVSNGGGNAALWSRDGRELYFVTRGRDMMAVSVRSTPSAPVLREPTKLFRLQDAWALRVDENYTPFDIAPDGRFLMAERIGMSASPTTAKRRPVLYIQNWGREIERLSPLK